ncbi:MAG: hypothetical protein A2033_02120 [Bacteroidetes bacterium GWA2_31_9]|nr:MAG: hypothetical protein A2033_02120 [Bacteroidetes bacterium GWA2_31_9]
MKYILLLNIIIFSVCVNAQTKISFPSKDGLDISADFYEGEKDNPYILLFHQAGSSRGEYKEIGKKLVQLGFNCLAVDLRSGKESNYVVNETAKLASEKGLAQEYIDTKKDIEAAIEYAFEKNKKQVVLFGSSYSASLSLVLALKNEKVQGVVAFSPGEFFKPSLDINQEIKGFDKPVFIASSQREYPYVFEYDAAITSKIKTFFKPQNGQGEHGAKSLWKNCETNKEYWLALMLFLKQFN